jgi:hypothetical protein
MTVVTVPGRQGTVPSRPAWMPTCRSRLERMNCFHGVRKSADPRLIDRHVGFTPLSQLGTVVHWAGLRRGTNSSLNERSGVGQMERPCWGCGSTKLDPVEDPFLLYWLLRAFGVQLCHCGGCHRFRLSRRSEWVLSPIYDPTVQAHVSAPPASPPPSQKETGIQSKVCPRCGSQDIQRLPHLLAKHADTGGPMARCLVCKREFTL